MTRLSTPYFGYSPAFLRLLVAAILIAGVALAAVLATQPVRFHPGGAGIAAMSKGEADANSGADVVAQRGEADRGPDTMAEEKAINRALPLTTISWEQTQAAQQGFQNGEDHTDREGRARANWSLLGPSNALVPGSLSFTHANEVASGRISALAIGPSCSPITCQVWVGAAGGGIWRTDNGLAANPTWRSVSAGLPTNAIGSLLRTSSGVLYAGTGEANASGDSEAGLGLYRSTNGGDSWALVPGSFAVSHERAISGIAVDPTNASKIYISTARAVRGVASVTGGGSTPPGAPAFGVYASNDGGTSFTSIWTPTGSLRGVNHLELDPTNPSTIYASAFSLGMWRRTAANPTFEQVFVPASSGNTQRTEFALTTKSGHTRAYVGDGSAGTPKSAVYRNDNLDVPAATVAATWHNLTTPANGTPGYATYNYCTGQCWYDNAIVTPAGHPDTVYVLGSFQYGEFGFRSNGRAVVRSTTAGEPDPAHNNRTFTDMTWDATSATAPNGIHPDQHALVVSPSNPDLFFEGSDGGLIRSSGQFADASAQCDARPLGAASQSTCHRLLSAIPTELIHVNRGLPTLQFQSLSASSSGGLVMGGTQDNGTWLFTGDRTTWTQTIYGDGGQSGFNVADSSIRFNSFFGSATDSNFAAGEPTKWVVTSGPLLQSGEASAFYSPEIADPKVGGTMFIGLQHVWRTTDNGGNRAFLEANCPEFTANADDPACGDWKALGQDLTGLSFGADKSAASSGVASYVVATARSKGDKSTLWAATRQGRVFISSNTNAVDPTAVNFSRLDSLAPNSPSRFVSGIVVDPQDPNHAWISYSGYNVNNPTAAGHVFEVTYTPAEGSTPAAATWNDLTVETNTGDLPITGLTMTGSGTLYASTDFGVLRQTGNNNDWEVAGTGLPRVEVAGLTISADGRSLYAATHGRGAWVLPIGGGDNNGGGN